MVAVVNPAPPRMLYQGLGVGTGVHVQVTTRSCVVNHIVYPMADLTHIGVARSGLRRPSVPATAGLLLALLILILATVAVVARWTIRLSIAVVVAVAATAAVTALPAAAAAVLRRPYQIWAQHHGAPVLLFATLDRQQHGQVARALLRAREHLT